MSIHPAMKPGRRMVQCKGIVSLAMPCFSMERRHLLMERLCSPISYWPILSLSKRHCLDQAPSLWEIKSKSQKILGAPVGQWVKSLPTDQAVQRSSSARGEIFSTVNGITLHTTLSLSSAYRTDMTGILLKRTKS